MTSNLPASHSHPLFPAAPPPVAAPATASPGSKQLPPGATLVFCKPSDPCPICLQQMTEPCTYSCGHIACRECLLEWHKQTGTLLDDGRTMRYNCPTCRKPVHQAIVVRAASKRLIEYVHHAGHSWNGRNGRDAEATEDLWQCVESVAGRNHHLEDEDILYYKFDRSQAEPCMEWLTHNRTSATNDQLVQWDGERSIEDIVAMSQLIWEYASKTTDWAGHSLLHRLWDIIIEQLKALATDFEFNGDQVDMAVTLKDELIDRVSNWFDERRHNPLGVTYDNVEHTVYFNDQEQIHSCMFNELINYVVARQWQYYYSDLSDDIFKVANGRAARGATTDRPQ